MTSEVKSWCLRLTGKAELPKPLVLGNDYTFRINGAVTSQTEKDNADGTKDIVYKFEPYTVEEE